MTSVEIPEHYGKILLLIRLSAPGLWGCKIIIDPLTASNPPDLLLTSMHRHTAVYWGRYHLTEAKITPRATEGRLQRSFLWDKSVSDGGWWALDRHEWEAVLGKKERWRMVPSQQWDTKPRERLNKHEEQVSVRKQDQARLCASADTLDKDW